MRDRGRIILGLLVFLVLITVPIWFNLASGQEVRAPELELPSDESQCLLDTDYMRREHMQLLMDWRDEVVRDNDRIFATSEGRRFYKSLSGTCMSCHANKDAFCDRCHDYLGVKPYCWDCHVEPKEER